MEKWNVAFNYFIDIKHQYLKKHNNKIDNDVSFAEMVNEIDTNLFENIKIKQTEDIITVKYEPQVLYNHLWDSVLKECRGITFNIFTEELITTGFPKFFNIEEYDSDEIYYTFVNADNIEVTEKVDGVMICIRKHDNPFNDIPFFVSTTVSHSPKTSWRIARVYEMIKENNTLYDMLSGYGDNYTFIFEYVSPKSIIVVPHENENLILLNMRNMNNGKFLSYWDAQHIAKVYNIDTPKSYNYSYQEIIQKQKDIPYDYEGWVIKIGQQLFKAKGNSYVKMHKLVHSNLHWSCVIESIYHNTYEEIAVKLPRYHLNRYLQKVDVVRTLVRNIEYHLEERYKYYTSLKKENNWNKAEILQHIQSQHEKWEGLIIRKMLNKDYDILYTGKRLRTAKELGINDEN